MRLVGERDPALDALACRSQLLHQRSEGRVEEYDLVLGIIDDVKELIVEESGIDGVDDRSHARHRVVQLEMPMAVPGERSDPVAGLDAEAAEGAGEAPHADMGVAIGVAMDGA